MGEPAYVAAVVVLYNTGGGRNAHLDGLVRPLNLTTAEQRDLVAFHHALSSGRH